jgi:hypothetical protein
VERIIGMKNVYRLAGSINSWATNPEYSQQLKTIIIDNKLDEIK